VDGKEGIALVISHDFQWLSLHSSMPKDNGKETPSLWHLGENNSSFSEFLYSNKKDQNLLKELLEKVAEVHACYFHNRTAAWEKFRGIQTFGNQGS
jgi:hypothetical protein